MRFVSLILATILVVCVCGCVADSSGDFITSNKQFFGPRPRVWTDDGKSIHYKFLFESEKIGWSVGRVTASFMVDTPKGPRGMDLEVGCVCVPPGVVVPIEGTANIDDCPTPVTVRAGSDWLNGGYFDTSEGNAKIQTQTVKLTTRPEDTQSAVSSHIAVHSPKLEPNGMFLDVPARTYRWECKVTNENSLKISGTLFVTILLDDKVLETLPKKFELDPTSSTTLKDTYTFPKVLKPGQEAGLHVTTRIKVVE